MESTCPMLRSPLRVRLTILITLLTGGGPIAAGDELFPGYVVSAPYSGPVQYQVDSETITRIFQSQFDEAKPSPDWTYAITPEQFLAKVAPNLDPGLVDGFSVESKRAGDYAIGAVYVSPKPGYSGLDAPSVKLFVTDGIDFRSNQATLSLFANDNDIVASHFSNLNANGQFLFRLGTDSVLYDFKTDSITQIPYLPNSGDGRIYARGIDNAGNVVGSQNFSFETSGFSDRAFIYRNGVMTDLNDLVKLNDELLLVHAYDLTETGEIIARMANTWSGQEDWVKLTPAMVPEPSSWIVGLMGILATAWQIRRNRKPKAA